MHCRRRGCVWREYAGGYEDWLAAKDRAPLAVPSKVLSVGAAPLPNPRREARNKLSYREAQELALLPDRIGALEREQAEIVARLADASIYREAPDESKRLQTRTVMLDAELEQMLLRWEELEKRVG